MTSEQLTEVVAWLTDIAAHGTTAPVRTHLRVRTYIRGGSIFSTSVAGLLADPQFPGYARALDVTVNVVALKKRRHIFVECLPGFTRVRVIGEDKQWVRFAYRASRGIMWQQTATLWQLRNILVVQGGLALGTLGQLLVLSPTA